MFYIFFLILNKTLFQNLKNISIWEQHFFPPFMKFEAVELLCVETATSMCENDTSHGKEAHTLRQNQQLENKNKKLKKNNKRNALGPKRYHRLFKSSVSMSHAALKKHIQVAEGAGISYVSPSQTLKFLSLIQHWRRKKRQAACLEPLCAFRQICTQPLSPSSH